MGEFLKFKIKPLLSNNVLCFSSFFFFNLTYLSLFLIYNEDRNMFELFVFLIFILNF